jgi:hypothetical protein
MNYARDRLFYFLTSLLQEKNYDCKFCFIFNKVVTETKKTILVRFVSLFNEVSTKMQDYPHGWFHFLMILKSKNHAQHSSS